MSLIREAMRRLLAWLWCRLRGHHWRIHDINYSKARNLMHLHPMAGYYATCGRCGEVWDDRGGWPVLTPCEPAKGAGQG